MKQDVKKHVYPNGLTLICDETPVLQSVTLGAWVKTGSRNEEQSNWGMCHFLEHMMFKGGPKRNASDIAKEVDRIGGDFNAFTSREHTCFHFYLPAKELPLGIDLLKEILFKPAFEKKEIERERLVILQEIAMTKENPEEDSFDRWMQNAFSDHPLGRQILGSEESVKAITRATLLRFFYQHYRPENMILAVSGAVRFEKVRKLAEVLGGIWPNRKRPLHLKAQWGVDPPLGTTPGMEWLVSDTEQAHVLYGFPAPVASSKDRIVSQMIQQYLGGGMSSVYFDEIREKRGWAYSVYATAVPFLDHSVFLIYAGVKPERVMDTLKVFRRELLKMARNGIPAEDLKRLKQSLLSSFHLSLENSESRMLTISNQELFFKTGFSFRDYEIQVQAIRSHDLLDVMDRWLQVGPPTVLVLSKQPRGDDRKAAEQFSLQVTKEKLVFSKE
jgi:predicted Zn-dependent peptidase